MTYVPPGPIFTPGVSPLATDLVDDPRSGLVRSWSYSTLKKYEQCPYAVYLDKVKKLEKPPAPAAERGTYIHQLAEDYVKGELGELPTELNRYRIQFEKLRASYEDGRVMAEDEWAFTTTWEITEWTAPDAWCRMKLDCLEFENNDASAIARDYKTGRRFGNEMAHGQQLQLYAIASFTRYPTLEYIATEAWYLDRDEPPLRQEYTRREALSFQPRWTTRATALTTATHFPPKPSRQNCRFCDFAKTGACEWREL